MRQGRAPRLPVHVVQDLEALAVQLRQLRHARDAPLDLCNDIILLPEATQCPQHLMAGSVVQPGCEHMPFACNDKTVGAKAFHTSDPVRTWVGT